MNKFYKKSFFYLCVISLVSYQILDTRYLILVSAADIKGSIDQKTQELLDITNKINENQKILEAVQGQSQTLETEIKKINTNISQVSLGIKSSELTVDKLELEIDSLHGEISDAEKEVSLKEKAIAQILREFQKGDHETPFLIFLKNKSLADSVFEIQNLSDLSNGLSIEINNLKNAKENLSGKVKITSNKKQSIEAEKESLKNKQIILSDAKNEKQSVLAQTKNQEKIYQQTLTELQKKQAEIASEIEVMDEELRLKIDPSALPSKRPGVLAWPVGEPLITQDYGKTAFASWAYKSKFHNGIDLRAPLGTSILAAEDGEIIMVGNNGKVQYGKFILIKHNNNLITLYAHLSRQAVKKGDTVKRGQVIGYSGNTGYSYGSHLHFTVYLASSIDFKSFSGAGSVPIGATINPKDYL